ncbi:nuclease [Methylibium sp. Pch-M]|uniref:thermonuclease family protein n=1 Tax=Methylibium sp. Pch-M TaxID=2082386 RepID=UPI00101354A3|nr:thermonuclease family protein [Methylibium sp. Pch-M]QAZ38476.1 nuclease [Methylibium sp. Pch-M]
MTPGRRQVIGWLAAIAVSGSAAAAEERFDGVVTRITDGDTVWVRPDATEGHGRRKPVKLRLAGLDAPERCQPHGSAAGAALAARVQDRRVTVRRRATDMHGRALGTLWLDEQDVGAWLVAEGHAWSSRYGRDPGPYAAQEQRARAAGRGLFAVPDPELPRDFRRRHGPCD